MTREETIELAFQRVFGTTDSHRSPEQLIVMAILRGLAKPGESQWAAGQDGTALAFAQGKLRMWQAISTRIEPKPITLSDISGLPADNPGANDDE